MIEKITDRTLTTETKTGSSPPVRLAREVLGSREEELTGVDREEHIHSNEFVQTYNKRVRQFAVPESDNDELLRVVRKPRDSSERVERATKNATSPPPPAHVRPKPKSTLVKKPIPKYNEMDYDDDFQMKVNKSPVKIIDSGEHEDEDFNLNDYDFDVNHDEFVGRGKPLEPRIKHKEIPARSESSRHEPKPAVAPEIKIKSKVHVPTSRRGSNKKERSAEINKKPGEKEDYYDEPTTTKASEKARDADDDFNDENEESKEYDSKVSTVRLVRSPWTKNNVADKLGEKITGMSQILSILPMFPQVPNKDKGFGNELTDHGDSWSNKRLAD